ncbi:Arp Ankyrin repeat [Pyrenophora tritici-repentis]|nr:Arp Ankyrin repeat [Pyrenophora tritici-repentis]
MLLDAGADVNAQGGHYGNALQAASTEGHEQVVKMLLDAGAEVNAQGGEYGNALQAASAQGHEQVVKALLDAGAEVNAQCGYYGNALHAAAYFGESAVLKLLVLKHDFTQLQDPYDRTLLWWAAAGGHSKTVQVLVNQHNYDPQIPDKFGRTPCEIATRKGHSAVSKLFSKEGGLTSPVEAALPDSSKSLGSAECDVCTSVISSTDVYYYCRHCSQGDWYVCEDCRTRGAICADKAHILVKGTEKD